MSEIKVDTVAEKTSANGVTVDGLNIKDSKLVTANSVVETNLTDNIVTLAKMASGTDGNIISYDASGNPVAIATGNDGQVLTSTGAGSPPAFETPSGVALSGSTNNTVATVTGANALVGESNLLFSGNDLTVGVADNGKVKGTYALTLESPSGEALKFNSGGANERMRIDASGNLMVGKSSTSDTTTGSQFTTNGGLVNVLNSNGYNIINRQSGGGTFIYFKQVNSTDGSISVSGATVSYNSFTGTHWSRLSDNSKPTILKGTVLETLDEMVDWYNLEFKDSNDDPQKISHLLTDGQSNGDIITYNHKGTDVQATIIKEEDIKHCQTKISTTSEAKNVYGVFHCWDFGDDDGVNDMQVAAVGTYVVRIKSGETVTKGDLLQSNGDGTAKVQSDDNIKSSSFAKVLSNTKIETYDDGSFIVPCSLNC